MRLWGRLNDAAILISGACGDLQLSACETVTGSTEEPAFQAANVPSAGKSG